MSCKLNAKINKATFLGLCCMTIVRSIELSSCYSITKPSYNYLSKMFRIGSSLSRK